MPRGFCSVRKSIRPRVQDSLRGHACIFPCPSAFQPSRRCDSHPLVPPEACGGLGCRTENVVVVQSRITAKNLLNGVPLGYGLENGACLIALANFWTAEIYYHSHINDDALSITGLAEVTSGMSRQIAVRMRPRGQEPFQLMLVGPAARQNITLISARLPPYCGGSGHLGRNYRALFRLCGSRCQPEAGAGFGNVLIWNGGTGTQTGHL